MKSKKLLLAGLGGTLCLRFASLAYAQGATLDVNPTASDVDAIIAEYYQTLEDIKNGTLYSKEDGDGASYAMIPPSDDVECSYGVDVVKENGKSTHIGDYSTKGELDQAIQEAVESGKLTE